jgi:hypothetical protein
VACFKEVFRYLRFTVKHDDFEDMPLAAMSRTGSHIEADGYRFANPLGSCLVTC